MVTPLAAFAPSFAITKDFAFSASHVLTGLPEEHPCGRVHGHNYIVRVGLSGPALDGRGFLVDYGDLSGIGDLLDVMWDHRHLNDVLPFGGEDAPAAMSPTAERMAAWIADRVVETVMGAGWGNVHAVNVGVSETPKTWAWCTIPLLS
jgi:6-pyruvoyltetrahydropterin/6-carboxytetrahydropterin synthase